MSKGKEDAGDVADTVADVDNGSESGAGTSAAGARAAGAGVAGAGAGSGGTIRKHSSGTDTDRESPSKPPRHKKQAARSEDLMTVTSAISNLEKQLGTAMGEQREFRQMIEKQFKEININMKEQTKQLRAEFAKKIDNVQQEVVTLKNRVKDLEEEEEEPFDPEVTVVITGLEYDHDENLREKGVALVTDGLDIDVDIINIMRTPMKDERPGIVKIEFRNKEDKIKVLQNKQKLKDNVQFANVYMRSSFPHAERVARFNTHVLLREIGVENKYHVSGNGRLVTSRAAVNSENDEQTSDQDEPRQGRARHQRPEQRRNQNRDTYNETRQEDRGPDRTNRGRGRGRGGPRRRGGGGGR